MAWNYSHFYLNLGYCAEVPGWEEPHPRQGWLHSLRLSQIAAHVPYGSAGYDQPGPLSR